MRTQTEKKEHVLENRSKTQLLVSNKRNWLSLVPIFLTNMIRNRVLMINSMTLECYWGTFHARKKHVQWGVELST